MRLHKFLRGSLAVLGLLAALCICHEGKVWGQTPDPNEGLSQAELESIAKAKGPEDKLKACIEVATERMKVILTATRKEKGDELAGAVMGFRSALNNAEDLVAKSQDSKALDKKMTETLLKATRKYNSSLLETLKKASEDLRKHIEAAFEVSQRISDGLALQLQKPGK